MKIIGVDIGGTKIDVALINQKKIERIYSCQTPSGENKSVVISAVENAILQLFSEDVAGIIINNKLYSGRFCGAGEFGTVYYLDKTVETYASGQFF